MKTIIVYFSHSGNNEALAKELRLRFGCEIVKIEEQKRRTGLTILLDLLFKREPKIHDLNVYLDEYNTVIFVAPIWDAGIATPLVSCLKKEKKHINSYAFITLCGGREGQERKIVDQLCQLTSKTPVAFCELAVNQLLPPQQKGQAKFVTPYRIKSADFSVYERPIQDFMNSVNYSVVTAKKSSLEAL